MGWSEKRGHTIPPTRACVRPRIGASAVPQEPQPKCSPGRRPPRLPRTHRRPHPLIPSPRRRRFPHLPPPPTDRPRRRRPKSLRFPLSPTRSPERPRLRPRPLPTAPSRPVRLFRQRPRRPSQRRPLPTRRHRSSRTASRLKHHPESPRRDRSSRHLARPRSRSRPMRCTTLPPGLGPRPRRSRRPLIRCSRRTQAPRLPDRRRRRDHPHPRCRRPRPVRSRCGPRGAWPRPRGPSHGPPIRGPE